LDSAGERAALALLTLPRSYDWMPRDKAIAKRLPP
jgi:hypothetical protein